MKISVVIPFYNLERYVRPCLDSVVAAVNGAGKKDGGGQRTDFLSVEAICVDDGSTDGTGEILDTYPSSLIPPPSSLIPPPSSLIPPPSSLIPHPSSLSHHVLHKENGGEGSARNAGLAAATGEWVTFLDGDDVWLPTVLTEFAAVAARHPDADIIGFRFLPFEDGKAPPSAQTAGGPEKEYDVRREIPSEAVLDLGVFPTFFRREKFSDVAFSALPLGADRLYVAQCLAMADRLVMSSAGVHGYRVRAGSMARAAWNGRKIRSMIDFASGSLAAFEASGKRVGGKGVSYLADVLLSVAPKQIRRMEGERTEVRRHLRAALASLKAYRLSLDRRMHLLMRLATG